jgi:hypothetical protein
MKRREFHHHRRRGGGAENVNVTFLDARRAAIFYCAGARKFTCFLVA